MTILTVDTTMRRLEARYTAERPDALCVLPEADEPYFCGHRHDPIDRPAGVYPVAVRDWSVRPPRWFVVLVRFRKRKVGGWYVVRADNGRRLGWVVYSKDLERRRGWAAMVEPSAFRGSGVDDTGDVLDEVHSDLYFGSGSTFTSAPISCDKTREDAAGEIVWWLVGKNAPAVGYGRHPAVRVHATEARQHMPIGEPEHCSCSAPWPCPIRAELEGDKP